MDDADFLRSAIEQSRISVAQGGFPAGAVLVKDSAIVAMGISVGNVLHDPTSHGEVATIREACSKLGTTNLSECTLYTSLEPCAMCLAASMWASIPKAVFACSKTAVPDDFYGGHYDSQSINKNFLKPLALVHEQAHQTAALEVINEWNKTL